MSTIDGYVRVSQVRGRDGDSFISPDQQEDRIRSWASARDFEVGEVHVELDAKGDDASRPKLLAAIERIERGESAGLVVGYASRFGRSLLDGLALIERVRAAGGLFASVADGLDTSTETGRLVLRIMLSIAEHDLERVRGNFQDARARAVGRGIHPSPVPPFGYTRPEDDDGHILGPLVPDVVTGPLVSELFVKRAAGVGPTALARLLEAAGARTPYDSGTWTLRGVRTMLANRVYLGEARHGEFVNAGAHLALTDPVTFRQAQAATAVRPSRSPDRPAVLAGLLRCAGCRHAMGSFINRQRSETYRQYRCQRTYPAGRCPEPASIAASAGIEDHVTEAFFEAVGRMAAEPVRDDGSLADLERAAAEAEDALRMFRDDERIIATLGADAFAEGLGHRRTTLDAALDALGNARRELEDPSRLPSATDLRALWPSLDVEEKRRLLRLAVEAVFVRRGRGPVGERASVVLRGEGVEIPRAGGRARAELLPPFRFEAQAPARAGVAVGEEVEEGPLDRSTRIR